MLLLVLLAVLPVLFSQGPVEDPVIITSEKELIDNFGKPSLEDNHYEYWYAASDFMSYGGSLSLVRCDGTKLKHLTQELVLHQLH